MPVPYQRATPLLIRGKVRVVKPSDSKEFQNRVALCARVAGVAVAAEGPVALYVVSYLSKVPHAYRSGDFDNYAKNVSDALNGVAWRDDCQVTLGVSYKAFDPDRPRTEVFIVTGEALPPWPTLAPPSP